MNASFPDVVRLFRGQYSDLRATAARQIALRPNPIKDIDDHRTERIRIAVLSAIANFASKAISMVLMVVSIYVTIDYLGKERFGIWMTLNSLIAMLGFLDLGVGNSMTNLTAKSAAFDRPEQLRHTISSGLIIMAMCGLFSGLSLFALALILPWGDIFNVDSSASISEARSAAAVFAVGFAAILFSGGIQKVYLGLQRAIWSHLASFAATLVTIAAICIAAANEASIPVLLAITLAGQSLVAIPLAIALWHQGLLRFAVPWRVFSREAPQIFQTGGLFFLLQIGMMVGWGSDMLVISATAGAAATAYFAITQRLFQFASIPLQIMSQPLWGAYADANARNDTHFIKQTLIRSIIGASALAIAMSTILFLLHEPLVAIWSKNTLVLPVSLVAAYAIWTVLEAIAVTLAMYMNGCAIIRPQIFSVILFCLLSIPMKILLADNFGATGIVVTSIAAWLIAVPLLNLTIFRVEFLKPTRPVRTIPHP